MSKFQNRLIGKIGEDLARDYLVKQGNRYESEGA